MVKPLRFTVIITPEEAGGYSIRCLELPGAISQGETKEEAIENIRDAILTILDMMKEQGEAVPVRRAEVRELELVVA